MPRETVAAKRERAIEIARRMNERYPKAECALHYDGDPFRLVIAVLLSAQTTDKGVNKVTPALWKRYPTPADLASADVTDVEEIIRAIGFYRTKAANCVKCAQLVVSEYGGEIPRDIDELQKLPGVGRKTANVVLNEDDMTVWWEGMTKQPPKGHLRNWKGEVWDGSDGTRGAHPNSRFTAPAENCPCISEEFFKGTGVPISAIIFGGRRAKTAPLVYQSRDWAHGVFVGATMASETTAAATGAVGVVRRDPMARRPFCGYNMADYWQHWLDMGEKLPNAPKIFNVNWFRTDDNGRFLWPGFGDNLRVLEWILKRCFDEVGADETVIGYEPKPEDIDLDGSGVTVETLKALLTLDAESWRENCAGIREYFEQFGDKLPHELREELEALEKAFAE